MVLGGKGKTHTHKDTKNLARLSLNFDGRDQACYRQAKAKSSVLPNQLTRNVKQTS